MLDDRHRPAAAIEAIIALEQGLLDTAAGSSMTNFLAAIESACRRTDDRLWACRQALMRLDHMLQDAKTTGHWDQAQRILPAIEVMQQVLAALPESAPPPGRGRRRDDRA
jgi:hypothetical protein